MGGGGGLGGISDLTDLEAVGYKAVRAAMRAEEVVGDGEGLEGLQDTPAGNGKEVVVEGQKSGPKNPPLSRLKSVTCLRTSIWPSSLTAKQWLERRRWRPRGCLWTPEQWIGRVVNGGCLLLFDLPLIIKTNLNKHLNF